MWIYPPRCADGTALVAAGWVRALRQRAGLAGSQLVSASSDPQCGDFLSCGRLPSTGGIMPSQHYPPPARVNTIAPRCLNNNDCIQYINHSRVTKYIFPFTSANRPAGGRQLELRPLSADWPSVWGPDGDWSAADMGGLGGDRVSQ